MFVGWAALSRSCTPGLVFVSAGLRCPPQGRSIQPNTALVCQHRHCGRQKHRSSVHTAARSSAYAEDVENVWSVEDYDAPRDGQPGSGGTAGPSNGHEERSVPRRVNERDPRRKPYHRRLHEAARDGQPEEAAAILEEMSEHDLPPGPRAYHSLIVANAQAGRADEALNSLRAAWGEGLQPIPESYCAVISIFVGAGDMDTGKAVFNSMQRAGHDARPGWLAFVKACFGWGAHAPTWRAILWGLEQGLTPDADLFELFIQALALMPRRHAWAMQILKYDMRAVGVPPETRHANALIRGVAISRYPHEADQALQIILGGSLGAECRPNMDTFNALLEGVVLHKRLGTGLSEASPLGSSAALIQAEALIMGCRPNKATHALYCELAMLNRREEEAMDRWNAMLALAAPGQATELISDEAIFQLVQLNLLCRKPWHLVSILQALVDDGRLPFEETFSVVVPESEVSQLTSWLDWRLASERMQRSMPGKMQPAECGAAVPKMYDVSKDWMLHEAGSLPEEELWSTEMVDPLLLCICMDNGAPMAASRMAPEQHTAELGLKGRLVDGQDLYRAVLDSRLGTRPPLEVEVRRQEVELASRDSSAWADEEGSSGRRIKASKVGGASAVEVVETRADVTIGGRVYDAASDPDGDPDTDPFDERDRAGLAVERYMLRKALREQNGGKDPGQSELQQYQPEPHWQSPLPTAQLACELMRLAQALDIEFPSADFIYVAEAARATGDVEAAWMLGNSLLDFDPVGLSAVLEPAVQLCVATLEDGGHEEQAEDLSRRYMDTVTGTTHNHAALIQSQMEEAMRAQDDEEDGAEQQEGEEEDAPGAYSPEQQEEEDAAEAYSTEQQPWSAEDEARGYATQQEGSQPAVEPAGSATQSSGSNGHNSPSKATDRELSEETPESVAGPDASGSSALHEQNGNGHGNGNGAPHSSSANGSLAQTAAGAQ